MKKQKQLQVKLDPNRMKISDMLWSCTFQQIPLMSSIVGSVVEFSPATRETGVRFPDNALVFSILNFYVISKLTCN